MKKISYGEKSLGKMKKSEKKEKEGKREEILRKTKKEKMIVWSVFRVFG